MNRIKRYNKKGDLSISLNFLFGIHSYYKYEKDIVHQFTFSKEEFLYKEIKKDQTSTFNLTRNETLVIKKWDNKKSKEYFYNPRKNTLNKKLIVNFEVGREVKINDYLSESGKQEREIVFNNKIIK